ncbi:hypothetical protein BC938DRAFT_478859 [Jimgerdemannia flammicorona]|uniref:Uncharacterized protein n=1 Tax=Jimgerdemannia flammicorona TaxID=994334 RepID=A0A433QM43_9FUNG|nr:hypothetical protein BC938DRAFT_478859 [Jimgerdemannia flammicorona]
MDGWSRCPRRTLQTMIENYRIPSILNFAKVRLHVGPTAPTTLSCRQAHDGGEFEHQWTKVINAFTAAATQSITTYSLSFLLCQRNYNSVLQTAFGLGSAESKVASQLARWLITCAASQGMSSATPAGNTSRVPGT